MLSLSLCVSLSVSPHKIKEKQQKILRKQILQRENLICRIYQNKIKNHTQCFISFLLVCSSFLWMLCLLCWSVSLTFFFHISCLFCCFTLHSKSFPLCYFPIFLLTFLFPATSFPFLRCLYFLWLFCFVASNSCFIHIIFSWMIGRYNFSPEVLFCLSNSRLSLGSFVLFVCFGFLISGCRLS